jgi:HAD superfamily hydrolase (TIGR01549 family)
MEPAGDRVVRGVPAVVGELGLAGTEAGEKAVGGWFFDGCLETLGFVDGARQVLEGLSAKYVLAIITNGGEKLQRAKFVHLDLVPIVEHLVISEVVGVEKPDVRIFARACSATSVEPSDVVFVGDRLDVDVAGAKGAGMRAVWFNHWGGSLDEARAQPDAVITRFAELPVVLATM